MNSKKSPSDEMQWATPNKNDIMHNIVSMRSPVSFKTPVKQADKRFKSYKNSSGCFTLLPNHITPPSGLTKFVARNPFESELTNRLHLSVISPTVFTKVRLVLINLFSLIFLVFSIVRKLNESFI